MTQPANSNYTSAEVQAVVQKLVLSTISRTYDTLGVRRTDLTFNDVQQAAAGVFILYPNSPFYVVKLGLQRVLLDQVPAEQALFDRLLAAVQVMGRQLLPVTDISPLFGVQSSLQNLATAAASRTSATMDITQAPAYQQLSTNAAAFLQGPAGQAVKQNGSIVQTPQQAVTTIPGLMTRLQASHSKLVSTVKGLVGAIDDYNSLNLPNVVIQSVLANAASLVGSDAAALNSLTPTQRLATIRQVVLNLLASQSLVSTFGSFTGPTDYYTLNGLGRPYSDAAHPANPASLISLHPRSYIIVAGHNDDLNITADGGSPVDVTLNPSTVAVLNGLSPDTYFVFVPPSVGPPVVVGNDVVKVSISGDPSSPYTIPLTDGTRTADQVVADFNAVLPSDVRVSSYYLPLRFHGLMDVPAGTDQTLTLTVPGSANFGPTPGGLGVQVGDSVSVLSGANAGAGPAGGYFRISAVTFVSGSWTVTVTGTTSAQPGALVEIGPAARAVRVACVSPLTQVQPEVSISVFGDTPVSANACATLGFGNGVYSQCLQSTADRVAADINTKTGTLQAGTSVNTYATVKTAHTDTTNASRVVFSEAEAMGTTTFATTTVTYTVGSLTLAGTISSGDTIALRSGPSPGNGYVITTVNGVTVTDHELAVGDVIVGTGSFAGTGGTNVDAEFGPTLLAQKYQQLVINGGPNNGTYVVAGTGATAIDVLLSQALPVVRALTSPTTNPLTMSASLGDLHVTFTSKNTTTASALSLAGTAASLFFAAVPATAVGTTSWFQLPSIPANLQAGDILAFYPSDYNEPYNAYEILSIIAPLNVIQVDQDSVGSGYIPDGTSWQFSVQPVPFARLHYGTKNDFTLVQSELQTWLDLPENQPTYFTNLNALVNPLLVNATPTAEQVGAAASGIEAIYRFLTTAEATSQSIDPSSSLQGIIPMFTIEPVTAVDTLIASYTAKGSDAAVDTLLSGAFTSFFGLTAETSSYAGAFQAATRAVAANDLPVSKMNRPEAVSGQLISQTTSPDFEYAANGVTEQLQGEQVNPPTDFGKPSNYGTNIGPSNVAGT